MQQFQTWYFEGDFDQQRTQMKTVEAFMKTQGYSQAWSHTRIEGTFVVFFREK